jgi:hypothetical protein
MLRASAIDLISKNLPSSRINASAQTPISSAVIPGGTQMPRPLYVPAAPACPNEPLDESVTFVTYIIARFPAPGRCRSAKYSSCCAAELNQVDEAKMHMIGGNQHFALMNT